MEIGETGDDCDYGEKNGSLLLSDLSKIMLGYLLHDFRAHSRSCNPCYIVECGKRSGGVMIHEILFFQNPRMLFIILLPHHNHHTTSWLVFFSFRPTHVRMRL